LFIKFKTSKQTNRQLKETQTGLETQISNLEKEKNQLIESKQNFEKEHEEIVATSNKYFRPFFFFFKKKKKINKNRTISELENNINEKNKEVKDLEETLEKLKGDHKTSIFELEKLFLFLFYFILFFIVFNFYFLKKSSNKKIQNELEIQISSLDKEKEELIKSNQKLKDETDQQISNLQENIKKNGQNIAQLQQSLDKV